MTHGSLFSGIGGFDLAAEWMGWENVFHCEFNPFCQKILKHYWPDAKSYGDITTTDFSEWKGKVDIVSGGFPCQPFSAAGKRKGKEDNRFLWPEMLRAIKEIQPAWIVAENVYGIINQGRGLVFEQVQAEMENEGYQVQSYLLPACAVNAPHRRDRFWFVAHSVSAGAGNKNRKIDNERWSSGEDRATGIRQTYGQTGTGGVDTTNSNGVITNNTCKFNERKGRQESVNDSKRATHEHEQEGGEIRDRYSPVSKGGVTTNTDSNQRSEGRLYQAEREKAERHFSTFNSRFIRRGWKDFPTVSPVRGRDDGLSSKLVKQCLEGLGNAIVPQVAYEIFKAIEQVNNNI